MNGQKTKNNTEKEFLARVSTLGYNQNTLVYAVTLSELLWSIPIPKELNEASDKDVSAYIEALTESVGPCIRTALSQIVVPPLSSSQS